MKWPKKCSKCGVNFAAVPFDNPKYCNGCWGNRKADESINELKENKMKYKGKIMLNGVCVHEHYTDNIKKERVAELTWDAFTHTPIKFVPKEGQCISVEVEPIEDSAADITQRVFDDMGLDHHDMMEFGRRCVKAGQNDYKERHKPKQTFEEIWDGFYDTSDNPESCAHVTNGLVSILDCLADCKKCRSLAEYWMKAAEKNRGYDETNSGD